MTLRVLRNVTILFYAPKMLLVESANSILFPTFEASNEFEIAVDAELVLERDIVACVSACYH